MSAEGHALVSEWASLLLASFRAAGVRDVVASPGSRSTPFVLAAARTEGLEVRDVVDERAAAFFALGQARVTGRPSLLICTSGTAPAHYLPAIIEASQSGLPLLALTADRPFSAQDCAAAQTVDQLKLFGDHVRRFVELGMPDGSEAGLCALARRAAQAVLDATWPTPGPVHLNVRAAKPLEPAVPRTSDERALVERAQRIAARGPTRVFVPEAEPSREAVAELRARLERSERALLVAGPGPFLQARAREAVFALAEAAAIPLCCDATSQLRFGAPAAVPMGDGVELLLGAPALRAESPDLVIQLGAPPIAASFEALLAALPHAEHVVIAPQPWLDPSSRADAIVLGPIASTVRAVTAGLAPPSAARLTFARRVSRANRAAWTAVDEGLALTAAPSEHFTARCLAERMPESGLLVLGNSLALRALETSVSSERGRCAVLSQRGANGIDGLVAGAAGAATSGRPTALLLGDVSLLHDLGGLAAAATLRTPLPIVVLQNGGGRIFEQLPIARAGLTARELAHFTTPHALSFRAAAELFGLPHARIETRGSLAEALDEALARPGASLVEVVLPAHGAASLQGELEHRAHGAIARALGLRP